MERSRQARRIRSNRMLLGLVGPILRGSALAAGGLVVTALPAVAQVAQVTPYLAVVDADEALFRSGEGSVYYPVAQLKRGQILRVDAENQWWARVTYPPGIGALAAQGEVEAAPDGKSVRVTKPTRLKAMNMTGGGRASWQALLPEDLPVGTRLVLLETIAGMDGSVFYRVEAPDAARGFVNRQFLRRATEEEARAFMARQSGGAPADPASGANPASTPTASGEPAPAGADQGATPSLPVVPQQGDASAQNQPPTGPRRPSMTPVPMGDAQQADRPVVDYQPARPVPGAGGGGERPAGEQPAGEQPTDSNPAEASGQAGQGVAAAPADGAGEPAPVPARPVATFEALESLVQQVQAQPLEQAELDEAIAELNRALGDLGESERDQRIATSLRARLEVLTIRRDLRDRLRAVDEATRALEQRSQQAMQNAEDVRRMQIYTVVGRLVPSNVYDGVRLPRMYRVISPDAGYPRTLGYVLAEDAPAELDGMLGRVVGVVGEARLDEALRANVIRFRRVDPLGPEFASQRGPVDASAAAPTGAE